MTPRPLRERVRREDGWALVSSLFCMAILTILGVTALGIADVNSSQTRQQREREAALTLTEGVLFAQSFTLARQWPGVNKPPFPAQCSSSMPTTGQCPNRDTLAAANSSSPDAATFRDLDVLEQSTWTTRVRDNYGPLAGAYDPALADGPLTGASGTCVAPCSRDFNGDMAMWVQARGVVRGKVRNLAALMRMEQLSEAVPPTGLTTGALKITNNGNKPMVDATGSQVVVRCPVDVTLGNNAICTDFRGDQITPTPQQNNPGGLMQPSQIERFRDRAIIDGTYYANCPPVIPRGVVFIENCQDPPNYLGDGATACTPPAGLSPLCVNTIHQPGVLIVRCGALRMAGSWTYVGLIYFVNGFDNSCPGQQRGTNPPSCTANSLDPKTVLDTQGGFGTWGGLAVDGDACVLLGSNGMQLKFDLNAFSALRSYGTVGLVQNTWRELPAGAGAS